MSDTKELTDFIVDRVKELYTVALLMDMQERIGQTPMMPSENALNPLRFIAGLFNSHPDFKEEWLADTYNSMVE
jgi:hypothetical protein